MIIFLHIAKTGGATLNHILEKVYGTGYYRVRIPYYEEELAHAKNNNYKCVSGHFQYGIHNEFNKQCQYITIIRNPLLKIRSYYYYMKYRESYMGEHHLDTAAKNTSLLEFAKLQFTELDNEMVRKLNGEFIPYGRVNSFHLEEAKKNLDKMIYGVTENYGEMLELFKNKLGWGFVPDFQRQNVSKGKQEMSQEEIKVISKKNKYDFELYDYARKGASCNTLVND